MTKTSLIAALLLSVAVTSTASAGSKFTDGVKRTAGDVVNIATAAQQDRNGFYDSCERDISGGPLYTLTTQAPDFFNGKDNGCIEYFRENEFQRRMMSNVVGCSPEAVKIGMPVEATFEDWTEEISVPKFKPVA